MYLIVLYGKKPMEFFERFLSFMNFHSHLIVHVNVQRTILVAIIKLINISKEKQIGYYLIRYIKQKIIILN